MIKEQATVQRVLSGKAIVKVQKHSACEYCESRGACDIFGGKELEVEVINELPAKEGDRVEVSLPGGSLLKLSLLVYFFPIVALIIGASIGNFLGPLIGTSPALGAIVLGGAMMGGTYWFLKRMERFVVPVDTYSPKVTKIISSPGNQTPADDSK